MRRARLSSNLPVVQVTSIVFSALPGCYGWCSRTSGRATLVFQLIGGVGWAGFSLAAGNFLHDVVSAVGLDKQDLLALGGRHDSPLGEPKLDAIRAK